MRERIAIGEFFLLPRRELFEETLEAAGVNQVKAVHLVRDDQGGFEAGFVNRLADLIPSPALGADRLADRVHNLLQPLDDFLIELRAKVERLFHN